MFKVELYVCEYRLTSRYSEMAAASSVGNSKGDNTKITFSLILQSIVHWAKYMEKDVRATIVNRVVQE